MLDLLKQEEWERYIRQMSLPEISPADQIALKRSKIMMAGAGGLGAAALPYLAGAGIGAITIIDHDYIDHSNLHRQTIYKNDQEGQSKAITAAAYLTALNPHCEVKALDTKITADNSLELCNGYDLILDGTDNFFAKKILNECSIASQTPFLSASIFQFSAMIGLFAGFAHDYPCYQCLFPELPERAPNCNEAGILGTTAGITGLYQAHMALCFLLGIGDIGPGQILKLDLKSLTTARLDLQKESRCPTCREGQEEWQPAGAQKNAIETLGYGALANREDSVIIDVRNPDEWAADPVPGALEIPLPQLATKIDDLPKDRLLALTCAANVRSRIGAELLLQYGFEKVCILDRKI